MTQTTDLSVVSNLGTTDTPLQLLFETYLNQHRDYNEFAQSRTNFQIEKFIATADNTPVNCFVNLNHQRRVLIGELLREVREATEMMREFEYKWKDVQDKTQPIKYENNEGVAKLVWYDLDKITHDHRVMEISINIKDKVQQMEYIDKILNRMKELHGGEFTREEYEAEAPEYWNKRLIKQTAGALMASKIGIDTGNYEAILNATSPSILPDSLNTPIDFPIGALHALTTGRLLDGQQIDVGDVINYLQSSTLAAIAKTTGNEQQQLNDNNVVNSFEALGVVESENNSL